MEYFELSLPSQAVTLAAPAPGNTTDVLCGVVASGNLEILVEAHSGADVRFMVETAADGFRETWDAVLTQFAGSHASGGLTFTMNDVGSTPAVVALRLAQAHESWLRAGSRA